MNLAFSRLSLCFILCFAGTSSASAGLYVQDRTFQLITQDAQSPTKQEFGTAFAIDPAGVLLTSFHSIVNVVNHPKSYRIMLNFGNELLPAQILIYDVASDLALVQIDRKLTATYTIPLRAPFLGERIFSIGYIHNVGLTQIEGNYSESIQSGPLSRYLVSFPMGKLSHEEVITNLSGEILGLSNANSVAFQNKTQPYSVVTPGSQVADLIRRSKMPNRRPTASLNSQEIIKQVDLTLAPWLQKWKTNQWKTNVARLDRFLVSDPAPNMKCMEDKSKKEFLQNTVRRVVCSTQLSFPISQAKDGGKILLYYSVVADPSNSSDLLKLEDHSLISDFKSMTGKSFDQAVRVGNSNPRFNCHHRFVETQNSYKTLAEYCMNPIEPAPGFYNFLITSTSVTSGRTIIAEMDHQGFSAAGIKIATELFLNGIKEGPPL